MHPLLWMNVMLNFICMGFAELWAMGRKRKTQNENMFLQQESNQRPLAFQFYAITIRQQVSFNMFKDILYTCVCIFKVYLVSHSV